MRTCGSVTRQRQHCVAGFFGLISREAFGDNGARRFLIVQGPRAPMLFWGCDGNTQALIGQFFFLSLFFFILQTTLEWSSLLCVSLSVLVWRLSGVAFRTAAAGRHFFFSHHYQRSVFFHSFSLIVFVLCDNWGNSQREYNANDNEDDNRDGNDNRNGDNTNNCSNSNINSNNRSYS